MMNRKQRVRKEAVVTNCCQAVLEVERMDAELYHEKLSAGSQSPGTNSNPRPPEYEAGVPETLTSQAVGTV